MKHLALFLIVFLLFSNISISQDNLTYYERLFYTCKVWGYVKYFHSEVADCSIDYDSVLVANLPDIKTAANDSIFNAILLDMINAPGETALPAGPLPVIPDSLMYNLDLGWHQDTNLSQEVRTAQDTIRERFRPRSHCLVGQAFAGGNPTFDEDDQYYTNSSIYADENLRILGLCRYWNIISYFFPYKDIMDQNWDTTLVEIIPYFAEAYTAQDYDLAWKRSAKLINDSHAFTNGGTLNSFFGIYYPKFTIRFIEDQTVVTKVHPDATGLKQGDVIVKIDGFPIEDLRDSLDQFAHGSNEVATNVEINGFILRGDYGDFDMRVKNDSGSYQLTLSRNWSGSSYYSFLANTGPVWYDTIIGDNCLFGYVDMDRLEPEQVEDMMNELWETDGIVFDIRNYPQGTLWTLVHYLFTEPIHIASFTVPDILYPGVLSWSDAIIGSYQSDVYDGRLVILFDERTLSQAEYTCMGLEQHPGSTKIGSQTRAADGNISTIYLPGYITSIFTGLGAFYPDYTQTQRIGIVPDIEVLPTIAGIRDGRDEVLEAAFDCTLVGKNEIWVSQRVSSIYPNPCQTTLYIELDPAFDDVDIEIFDLLGKRALAKSAKNGHILDIDISGLPAGYYIMKVSDDKMALVEKIVKL